MFARTRSGASSASEFVAEEDDEVVMVMLSGESVVVGGEDVVEGEIEGGVCLYMVVKEALGFAGSSSTRLDADGNSAMIDSKLFLKLLVKVV